MMTPYPVPVIASFSANGEFQPLYVRINNVSLKVLHCHAKLNCTHPTFQCTVEDEGFEKHITLTFNPTSRVWLVSY